MKKFTLVIEVEAESGGVNGSRPTPEIMKAWARIGLRPVMGKVEGLPLKVKSFSVVAVSKGRK